MAERRYLDLAEARDRLVVGALDLVGLLGPWREYDREHVEACRAGGLECEQCVVDRAQARPCGDQQGQFQCDGEVAHGVVLGKRREQAPDALDYQGALSGGG
jgi:hypothetical protein